MMMKAAGYKCPFCGFEDGEFEIIAFHVEQRVPISSDLEYPRCQYQWREFTGNTPPSQ